MEGARSWTGFIGVGPRSASNIWTCTIMYLCVMGAVEQVAPDVYDVEEATESLFVAESRDNMR